MNGPPDTRPQCTDAVRGAVRRQSSQVLFGGETAAAAVPIVVVCVTTCHIYSLSVTERSRGPIFSGSHSADYVKRTHVDAARR
jgi:hypothetical protein